MTNKAKHYRMHILFIILYILAFIFILSGVYIKIINKSDFIDEVNYNDITDKAKEIEKSSFYNYDSFNDKQSSISNKFQQIIDVSSRLKDLNSYDVSNNETIEEILKSLDVDVNNIAQLIKQYPILQKTSPEQKFYFYIDANNRLEYLSWLVSPKEEITYYLNDNGTYTSKKIVKKSIVRTDVISLNIKTNLTDTLVDLGLDKTQRTLFSNAINWQVPIASIPKGAIISLVVDREYVDDKLVSKRVIYIKGIKIKWRDKEYYAFRASNGLYYNDKSQGNTQTFSRYPLLKAARVTSPFNRSRKHPITGLVRPHNGVDFGIPTGTPIISPADGTVIKVAYQANGAGHYITIKHNTNYTTVYMHLSKIYVKVGQKINKGQRVALSGNTGRSTGPHLHYELHINNVPVNPMTVKLPVLSSLTTNQSKNLVKDIAYMKNLFRRNEQKELEKNKNSPSVDVGS